MVIENAVITIDPDTRDDFERAVGECVNIFRSAEGCHGMGLVRVVDDPSRYRLIIKWETVAHHESIFWESQGFKDWRSHVAKFFTETPILEYNEIVEIYF